jgi:prepilin-type N-terminal cleavage/methylation domain-containing protein
MSKWFLPFSTKLNTQLGLTLIEILIAIVIISLIGITFFPNLRKFNSDQQYRNELSNLKSSIESSKNMFSSGTYCTTAKPSTGWSVVISITSNIPTSFNQKGSCITSAGVTTTESINTNPLSNLTLQSSSCASPVTSIEMKFDKNGFSYACNGSSTFIAGTFSMQLQNKNNTSQISTISINTSGTISQN